MQKSAGKCIILPMKPVRLAFLDSHPHIASLVFLALSLLVMVLREPRYFTLPRFWAEEGTLHFAAAFSMPWHQTLFLPQFGYLNFWPNLAGILANLVPLEQAPLVTTLMALAVQLTPIVLILWSRLPIWKGWLFRLLGVAVYLFAALSWETWLNTTCSYTFFALITFLILLEETPARPARRWIYRALLLLAGLSGTLSCFLMPFFAARAFFEKDRERWLQTAILTLCVLLHMLIIFSYSARGNIGDRFHFIGFATLGATVATQTAALFTTGLEQAATWGNYLFALTSQDQDQFQILGRFFLAGEVILWLLLSYNLPRMQRFLFLGSFATLLLLPVMFSAIQDKYSFMKTGYHQRTFMPPNVVLGWMLLFGLRHTRSNKLAAWAGSLAHWSGSLSRLLCGLVLATALFWGIQAYSQPWEATAFWPDWRGEVETWRTNPAEVLRIQPEGWVVQLKTPEP